MGRLPIELVTGDRAVGEVVSATLGTWSPVTEPFPTTARNPRARYSDLVAVDLDTNVALREAVERARSAAEADGSLHPAPGEHVEISPEFREAIEKLLEDGTYAEAVAAVIAANP